MNSSKESREKFIEEAQQPNNRLNLVRTPQNHSGESRLTGSVFQLIELRDKLNETLAETTRLALPAPNENAPISRLPSEVLLHICRLACPRTTHRSLHEVIALTHVCRFWRETLLSCPIIWSHIYVWRDSPQPLASVLLQRSRGVPLTVNIQCYSDRTPEDECGCDYVQEDGDYCPHAIQKLPSLNFLEPVRAKIHTRIERPVPSKREL